MRKIKTKKVSSINKARLQKCQTNKRMAKPINTMIDEGGVKMESVKGCTRLSELRMMAKKAIEQKGLSEKEVRKTLGMKKYE